MCKKCTCLSVWRFFLSSFNIKTGRDFMHIPFRSDGEWGLFNNVQCFYFFFYWLWTTYIMSMCVLKFVFLCFLKLQMSKCVKLWCLQKSLQLWMPSFFKWWLWFGVEVKLSASSFSLLFLFRTHWESVTRLTNTVYHICPGFLQFTLSPLCSWPSLFWSMWWWLFWWNI